MIYQPMSLPHTTDICCDAADLGLEYLGLTYSYPQRRFDTQPGCSQATEIDANTIDLHWFLRARPGR